MRKHIPWLGAALVILIFFVTLYATVQQAQRRDANYPQIQLAEDAAAALDQGQSAPLLTSGNVNINSSLAPFVIIYDKSGHVVAGSGYLNKKVPTVPLGMLRASNGKPYSFVTWQPQNGVRIAAVTVSANKYYVMSGRSLSEVEKNENKTFELAAIGFIGSLVVLAGSFVSTNPRAVSRLISDAR